MPRVALRTPLLLTLCLATSALAAGEASPPAPPVATPVSENAATPPPSAVSAKAPETPPAPALSPEEPSPATAGKELEAKPPPTPQPTPAPGVLATAAPVDDEDVQAVQRRAKAIFEGLLQGDSHPLVESALIPFTLEERRLSTAEELAQEWQRALSAKQPELLTLYGIEVLSATDMERRYGKPPARLANFPYRGPGRTLLAVANLSGHAAIAVFREVGVHDFRMVAYHD